MRCDTFREALSARIDGETEPVAAARLAAHLESCAGCRAWYARARDLRRWTTVRAGPDRTGRRRAARIALGLVAVAQLALSVAQLLGAATGMGATSATMLEHLTHESTAWNAAVGISLFWAALRPRAAAGQLPMLTGFVLVLTGLSVADLLGDAVTPGRLASHAFVLLGLALLFLVRRQQRGDRRPGDGETVDRPPSRHPRRRRAA